MYEDDDIDITQDIPECDIPEVIEVFDFCHHCDDDAPAPELVQGFFFLGQGFGTAQVKTGK